MRWFIILLLLASTAHAEPGGGSPTLTIQEESGTISGRPRVLIVTDGSLTDNGDRTFSLQTGGGNAASGDITRVDTKITQVTFDTGDFWIISRDTNGKVSGATDGTTTYDFTRDSNKRVLNWSTR